jgi:hypothetical protein
MEAIIVTETVTTRLCISNYATLTKKGNAAVESDAFEHLIKK